MQNLALDGHHWKLDFNGFSSPLKASTRLVAINGGVEEQAVLQLSPWTLRHHFDTLRDCVEVTSGQLQLNHARYADKVLESSDTHKLPVHWGESEEGITRLRSLALWWANGLQLGESANSAPPQPNKEGWVRVTPGVSAKLIAWTWGQKLAAQQRYLSEDVDTIQFEPVAYAEDMLRQTLVGLQSHDDAAPPPRLDELDARCTRRLLAAVTLMNSPDERRDPLYSMSPELAASTFRLCAAMGWTPDRVMSTPAAEIQRLLHLLDQVDSTQVAPQNRHAGRSNPAPTRRQPRRPTLADHPDAVVIQFGGEPQ